MCYNTEHPSKQEVDEYNQQLYDNAVRNDEWDSYYHRLSGFSHQRIPVLTQEDPRVVHSYNWGLIPAWCRNEEQAKEMMGNTLNARCDTIFEKPSYKSSIIKKRCLIYVKGFFEWRDFNKKKYPYYIYLKNQPVFSFGGIYETWINKDTGEIWNTTSIVTTDANPLMAQIHNTKLRMPLILGNDQAKEWINPSLTKDGIIKLMQPADERIMAAHTISKLITSRTENPNQEKVKELFEYAELPPIVQ
jgi:putative SOS response-associated peptidase YedK